MLDPNGPSVHSKVTGVDSHDPAIDPGRPDDGTVAGSLGFLAINPGSGRPHAGTEFLKSAPVNEVINPFPGSHFAPAVLPLNRFQTST
jgi:hypothetical protein